MQEKSKVLSKYEGDLVKSVCHAAYEGAEDYNVDAFLRQWERAKGELLELFNGKLRVTGADLDLRDAEDAEEESESANHSLFWDILREAFREHMPRHVLNEMCLSKEWIPVLEAGDGLSKYIYNDSIKVRGGRSICDTEFPSILIDEQQENMIAYLSYNMVFDGTKVNVYARAHLNFYNLFLSYLQSLTIEQIQENRTETGMKINKYIKTFLPPDPDLHNLLDTAWSRVLQKIKGGGNASERLVISIAPIDFLLHSEALTWGSCHGIEGERGAAGASLAMDSITAVAYVKNEETMARWGVRVDDKSWRQLIHIDVASGSMVMGNPYPHDNPTYTSGVRLGMMRLLADLHGVPRQWYVKRGFMGNISYSGIPYPDLEHCDIAVRTRLKDTENRTFHEPSGYIGDDAVICFVCGDTTENCEQPQCPDCNGMRCTACGDMVHRDETFTPPHGDSILCCDCWHERWFCCPNCGDHEDRDDMEQVSVRRLYLSGNSMVNEAWCRHCAEHEATLCGACECYTTEAHSVEVSGYEESWCSDCIEDDNVISCEACADLVYVSVNEAPQTHCEAHREESNEEAC